MRTPPDPLLLTTEWHAIRAYWVALALPCGRCGLAINYQAPGTSPAGLHVGHIVGRDQARAWGWSDDMINRLANTRPEHARCSEQAGARYGNRKRGQQRRNPPKKFGRYPSPPALSRFVLRGFGDHGSLNR